MFDPTVYDNLKVVLEGQVYDLDFSNVIMITERQDIVDLASMSRKFMMAFKLSNNQFSYPYAQIVLETSLTNLKNEMLDNNPDAVNCKISVHFFLKAKADLFQHEDITKYLFNLWGDEITIKQKVYYHYPNMDENYNKISVQMLQGINENNINDISTIIQHTIQSLQQFTLRYNEKK